jgi:peptide/nickel transport system ATP-binding protein
VSVVLARDEPQGARDLALSIRGLTVDVTTGRRAWPVVGNVSLDVGRGEIVGLVGESGSGKTTLCRAVAGLLHEGMRIEAGSVHLGDRDVTHMAPRTLHGMRPRGLAMIFQDPLAALNPVMRIGDQIIESLGTRGLRSRRDARRTAIQLLDRMGVDNAARRMSAYPNELSGGQRQRVMIATAMGGDPRLLLADEPTSALDVTTQAEILELLRELARDRSVAILLISHDYGVVSELCEHVNVMYAGRLVESGGTAELLGRPGHPYAAGLIASLPSIERRLERLPAIRGRAPSPLEDLQGCPFLPRCPRGVPARCEAAPMTLEPLPDDPAHRSACVLETNPNPNRQV